MKTDEIYMKRALILAKMGWGTVNPNPMVGAVIVKDGEIIAEGYHSKPGGPHAEIVAFQNAQCDVRGATMYVNLEPCSHYGRTPPCAEAIINYGIKRVVIATKDPNPVVSGKGIQMLKQAGIEVITGILFEEANKLNEIFFCYITRKKPFVIMKTAMTLDGKIASYTGDSKWISGTESREYVHTLRARVAAIMVGRQTVISDDPALTARSERNGGNPVRVLVDGKGQIPLGSRVFNAESKTVVATTSVMDDKKLKRLQDMEVEVIKLNGKDGHVDIHALMDVLYEMEIDSVLLEGGGGLNAAALQAGIVDKVIAFIAPKIIGGQQAISPVEGEGISLMRDAIVLKDVRTDRYGEDIFMEGYIEKCSQGS